MEKLIKGILEFRKNLLPSRKELFAKLATGQAPDVLFITCSDSRVAPNWFASTDPGDLFVVRNVGNMVPPCDHPDGTGYDHSVAAAIEFSTINLKIADIVVCGHSGCGAIHALAQGVDRMQPSHLKRWLKLADNALMRVARVLDPDPSLSAEDRLSQKNVLQQVENLKTYPKLRERHQKGELRFHAWWFNIAEGGVYAYDEAVHRFRLIDDDLGGTLLAQVTQGRSRS
ncbi:MAG TPA: carbonic anhydrase [Bdellovibrionota bacterium]|nr:carbonic anhydrase [Bdellovibrionota bacterium]